MGDRQINKELRYFLQKELPGCVLTVKDEIYGEDCKSTAFKLEFAGFHAENYISDFAMVTSAFPDIAVENIIKELVREIKHLVLKHFGMVCIPRDVFDATIKYLGYNPFGASYGEEKKNEYT